MHESDAACQYWAPSGCDGSVHCPPRCPRFVDGDGSAWVVRAATDDDRTALVEMYDDFAPTDRAQGLPPRTRSRIDSWVTDRLDDGCNFLVTGEAGVAAHALYTPTDGPEPEFAIFVHQEYQGRGVGTELSKHVLAAAAVGDRDALTLVVEPENRTARRLYDTLGFETVEDHSVGDRGFTSLRMRRPLGPDAVSDFRNWPPVRADRADALADRRAESD